MLIIITDEGRFWNHKNPILEQYSDLILVVCLNGNAVTDQYRCFVSPYERGIPDYNTSGPMYRALESVAAQLRHIISCYDDDDILFLMDDRPPSLFPYLILKNMELHGNFHLWCQYPFRFEGQQRRSLYTNALQDLTKIKSLICFDDKFSDSIPKQQRTMIKIFDAIDEYYRTLLPSVIHQIKTTMNASSGYYYDFTTNQYIQVNPFYKFQTSCIEDSMIEQGSVDNNFSAKRAVERLYPRVNGKMICEQLKEMRKKLAEANGIEFQSIDCPSLGSCAGTCPQCDRELIELQQQLEHIPPEKRIYPEIEVKKIFPNSMLCKSSQESPFEVELTTGIFERKRGAKVEWPPQIEESAGWISLSTIFKEIGDKE